MSDNRSCNLFNTNEKNTKEKNTMFMLFSSMHLADCVYQPEYSKFMFDTG